MQNWIHFHWESPQRARQQSNGDKEHGMEAGGANAILMAPILVVIENGVNSWFDLMQGGHGKKYPALKHVIFQSLVLLLTQLLYIFSWLFLAPHVILAINSVVQLMEIKKTINLNEIYIYFGILMLQSLHPQHSQNNFLLRSKTASTMSSGFNLTEGSGWEQKSNTNLPQLVINYPFDALGIKWSKCDCLYLFGLIDNAHLGQTMVAFLNEH